MRAELRDTKIAAAKARGEAKPATTLAQRRAMRKAAKYAGWRVIRGEIVSHDRRARRVEEKRRGAPMSGRQFRNWRKEMNRAARAAQRDIKLERAA